MTFCSGCGCQLVKTWRFCINCGCVIELKAKEGVDDEGLASFLSRLEAHLEKCKDPACHVKQQVEQLGVKL